MTNPTVEAAEIAKLVEQVAGLTRERNTVDVLIEVALFEPSTAFIACRSNDAGTKVVYTTRSGDQVTHWAHDWTHDADSRDEAARRLRARATLSERSESE